MNTQQVQRKAPALTFPRWLRLKSACQPARVFARGKTLQEAWVTCTDVEYLHWLACEAAFWGYYAKKPLRMAEPERIAAELAYVQLDDQIQTAYAICQHLSDAAVKYRQMVPCPEIPELQE